MRESVSHQTVGDASRHSHGLLKAVEGLRKQLLDIGKRNKLINAPIRKDRAKQITIEDELSDEIFRILYVRANSMTFLPADGVQADLDDEEDESVFLPTEDVAPGTPVASRHSDRKLQTRLPPGRLQKQLLTLYRDAQTLEEEQGVSILFLALGFLRWYESDSSKIERHAPLILLPVDLERDSARGKFRLKFRDQDLEPNLSLRAMLQNDHGLDLPDFPEGDDWLPSQYFRRVQNAVSSRERWRVRPNTIELSLFSFAKFLMWRDLDAAGLQSGAGSDLLERILVGGFESGGSIFAPDENLDRRFPDPRELGHIMDADASQTQVIAAACEGRNLVVQGPPGTGKSQTIANIIAAAAKSGKTVLFVAEKRAALDVVHDRLARCGLGPLCLELHSHKANRKNIYAELKRTLDLGEPREVSDERYERVRRLRDELNELAELLHAVDEATGETPYGVIGKIADLMESDTPRADFGISGIDGWSRDEFERRARAVAVLAAQTAEHGSEREHIWRGARRRLTQLDRRRLADRLREAVARLDRVAAALSDAAAAAGGDAAGTLASADQVARRLDALDAMPASVPGLLENEAVLEDAPAVLDLCESVAASQEVRSGLLAEVFEGALDLEWSTERRDFLQHGRSLFRFLSGAYRKAAGRLRSVHRSSPPKDFEGMLDLLDRLVEYRRGVRRIAGRAQLGREVFGRTWRVEETEVGSALPAVRWIAEQAEDLGSTAAVRRTVDGIPPGADLAAVAVNLRGAAGDWTEAWSGVAALVDPDLGEAFGVGRIEDVDLAALRARLAAWRTGAGSLENWLRLGAAARHASELGLDEIRHRIADGRVSPDDAQAALESIRAEAVWNRMRSGEPRLESIDGEERNRKIEEFKELDRRLQGLAAQEVALRHFRSMPAGASGQVGIVRGEIAKKMRHMRIRKLLDVAGEAVQSIKPVFLMSPLSVAQYLKAGGLGFDMLLIDEASQVRPADAMGAIRRCRQVVVVGDQKQMPPTSFFDRAVGADEESEDLEDPEEIQAAQAGAMESILSLCSSRSMAGGMLSWHYRSRHPSLIEVSNHEFYDNSLICPPSPDAKGAESGLSFAPVDGTYMRGKGRDNPKEAQAVCDGVLAHAREHPDQTLGVVALSVKQRDTIRNKLEFMRAEHPELEAFCKEGRDEPFFVKNLENVQGDERDVIFISIGYGKDAGGYMSQHFGPVSGDGGERRLNVLFTRAKHRCRVFSSIRHSDIRVDVTKHLGPRVLKRYLKFAETGELDIPVLTGAEMDSPFEEAVAKALHAHGYRVAAQVGSSGFRIDLAVYDPDDEGRFLLAIECDGARYHSSSWARERDRLRQAVLETKGWRFHRIWSTDWFYSRDAEVAKLLEAIEAARIDRHPAGRPEPAAPPPEVERAAPVEVRPPERTPYVEASFGIRESAHWHLHEVERDLVAKCVAEIVLTEGPVHLDEVTRRLARLWGYKRTGSRIRSAVVSGAGHAVSRGVIRYVDGPAGRFLDRCDRTGELRVRDRSGVESATLRRVDMLPPSEICAGILAAVERNIAIDAVDCAREVKSMLGFKSLSADMRRLVARLANDMVRDGSLTMAGKDFRLP